MPLQVYYEERRGEERRGEERRGEERRGEERRGERPGAGATVRAASAASSADC